MSIIRVLLSKNSRGCVGVMVNGREHRTEEKACQYGILRGHCEKKRGECSRIEIGSDKEWEHCS
jgi:hypothetical protein